MEKLFKESEMFIKERPKKLPEEIELKFYLRMAEEIINEEWSKDNAEYIADDLKELSINDSGFEMARDLDDRGSCDYDFKSDFIAWLEDLGYERQKEFEKIIKEWVLIHNIQPKFKKGIKLFVNNELNSKIKPSDIIFITGFHLDLAEYLVWSEIDHNGGYVISFERIEANCSIID